MKWTDKWAERLLPGGAREQWGDKWHEAFAQGRGDKNGEVWRLAASEQYSPPATGLQMLGSCVLGFDQSSFLWQAEPYS